MCIHPAHTSVSCKSLSLSNISFLADLASRHKTVTTTMERSPIKVRDVTSTRITCPDLYLHYKWEWHFFITEPFNFNCSNADTDCCSRAFWGGFTDQVFLRGIFLYFLYWIEMQFLHIYYHLLLHNCFNLNPLHDFTIIIAFIIIIIIAST